MAAVAAVAVLLWFGGGETPPDATERAIADGAQRSTPPDVGAAEVREVIETSAVLVVSVRDGGLPAPGRLTVCDGIHVADAVTRMHERIGVAGQEHPGSLTLAVSAGRWSWLRAEGPGAVGFALVPPFTGRKAVVVDLDDSPIHVLLLDASLSGGMADSEVRIARRPDGYDAQVDVVRTVVTDGNGYARVDGLGAGAFLFLAPRATPSSGFPAVQSLVYRPGAHPPPVVMLVAAPRSNVLELTVQTAPWTAKRGRQPRLYLERTDGDLYPFPADVSPGATAVSMCVSDGTYRVGIVPTGAAQIASSLVTVSGPTKHRVQVAELERSTEVRLANVGVHQLPLRIAAWPANAIDPPSPDLVYFGPEHWRRARATVPSLEGLHRLVGSGRGYAFMSRQAVLIDGPIVEVDLVPAARVRIEWDTWSDAPATHLCSTRTSVGDFARTFRRQLARRAGGLRPVWIAEFIVPLEPVEFECTDGHGGIAWRHSIEPKSWRQTIRIELPAR